MFCLYKEWHSDGVTVTHLPHVQKYELCKEAGMPCHAYIQHTQNAQNTKLTKEMRGAREPEGTHSQTFLQYCSFLWQNKHRPEHDTAASLTFPLEKTHQELTSLHLSPSVTKSLGVFVYIYRNKELAPAVGADKQLTETDRFFWRGGSIISQKYRITTLRFAFLYTRCDI